MARKKEEDAHDFDALLSQLRSASLGKAYTETDRYRDFRQVFLSTEQGKRVLWHIMDWGALFATTFHETPGIHALNEGGRNLALRIFQTIHVEPREKPTRQNVKREPNA